MKLVVAYIAPDRFEPIRETLLAEGIPSISALNSSGTSSEPVMSTVYRGTTTEQFSRLECVVGGEHAETVVSTVLKEGGERAFVYVVDVESAYPVETIKVDQEALPGQ